MPPALSPRWGRTSAGGAGTASVAVMTIPPAALRRFGSGPARGSTGRCPPRLGSGGLNISLRRSTAMRSSFHFCSCFLRASPRAAGSSRGSSPRRSTCEGSRTGPGPSSGRSRACIRRCGGAGTRPTHPSDQQVDGQRTPFFRIQGLQRHNGALRPPDEPGHLR